MNEFQLAIILVAFLVVLGATNIYMEKAHAQVPAPTTPPTTTPEATTEATPTTEETDTNSDTGNNISLGKMTIQVTATEQIILDLPLTNGETYQLVPIE